MRKFKTPSGKTIDCTSQVKIQCGGSCATFATIIACESNIMAHLVLKDEDYAFKLKQQAQEDGKKIDLICQKDRLHDFQEVQLRVI